MSTDLVANTARGVVFGVALTAAGIYLPSVIVDQMYLYEFHMMKAFLTASASSALLFPLFARSKPNVQPRSPSNLGWLGTYDGNAIGGALMGVGMTLTGACPGTVFVQVAAGVPSGVPVLIGSVLGGIAYVRVAPHLKTKAASAETCDKTSLTVSSKLKIDPNLGLLAFEAILVTVIIAASELQSTPSNLLNPVLGGLGVGLAQLASLALYGQPLGISGSYEEAGKWFWYYVRKLQRKKTTAKPETAPTTNNIQFALSVMLGTLLLRTLRPEFALNDNMPISWTRGILGGFAMAFGSRVAGGCTSGHGISGMSMLSVSSIVSVAAMFAGGMGLGLLLR